MLAQAPRVAPAKTVTYGELVVQSNALLKENKFLDAYDVALQAMEIDSNRFEAYLLIAGIQHRNGSAEEAQEYLQKALERAPDDKKRTIQQLASEFSKPTAIPQVQATESVAASAQRRYAALLLVIEDADKAQSREERQKYLDEFLQKSKSFIEESPLGVKIWTLRAAAALELERRGDAWEAGRKILSFGTLTTEDSKIQTLLANLERKGWLGERNPDVVDQEAAQAKRAKMEDAARSKRKEQLLPYVGRWRPDLEATRPLYKREQKVTGYLDIELTDNLVLHASGAFYLESGDSWGTFSKKYQGRIEKGNFTGIKPNFFKGHYVGSEWRFSPEDDYTYVLTGKFEAAYSTPKDTLFKNKNDLASWEDYSGESNEAVLHAPVVWQDGRAHITICPVSGLRHFDWFATVFTKE